MAEKQDRIMTHDDVRNLLAVVIAEHARFDSSPPPEDALTPGEELTFSMFSELLYGLRVRDLSGQEPKQLLPVDVEVECGQGRLNVMGRPHHGRYVEVIYAGLDPVEKPIPEGHPPFYIDIDHPLLVVAVRVLDKHHNPLLVSLVNNTVTPDDVGSVGAGPASDHHSEHATPSQAS
jgi:hypothetical protein